MDAKELFIQSNESMVSSGVFYCSTCKLVYGEKNKRHETAKETAEKCCVFNCKCGKTSRPFHTLCDECQSKKHEELIQKRFNDAEKVNDWDGWIYDESGGGYQEGFFESLEEALEWYESEELEPPEYFFLTKEIHFSIDFEGVVQDALENHHEDAQVTGLKEITEKVDEWVKSQNVKSYEPDYGKVIIRKQ